MEAFKHTGYPSLPIFSYHADPRRLRCCDAEAAVQPSLAHQTEATAVVEANANNVQTFICHIFHRQVLLTIIQSFCASL